MSPAVGIAVAIAMVRGFSRRNSPTIGNFWVDITRCMLYILLPIAFVAGIIFVGQGAVQTLAGPVEHPRLAQRRHPDHRPGPDRLHGGDQAARHQRRRVPQRQLGAPPSRTRPAFTNWLSIYLLLSIPFALTYTFGKMVGSIRHGAALLAAMVIIFGVWVGFTSYAEHQQQPGGRRRRCALDRREHRGQGGPLRRHHHRPVRRGVDQTSTGSADASYDSFTPIGGFGLLTGMMLGEVTPGGTGSGLYTILIYAIIAVFIGGLMIGRTPEYLGKKIQAKEVKLAGLGALVMPIIVLILTAIAVSIHAGRAGPLNAGPARVHRDPLRPHLAGQQQRLGLRRPHRQHRLLQRHRGHRHADRPVRHHDPGPGPRGRRWRPRTSSRRRSGPSAPTTACSSA